MVAVSVIASKSTATTLSVTIFESTELCAQTNPCFNLGGSLLDGILGGSDSVFSCYFRVKRVFLR
jgi:hypothetical protein